MQPLADTDWDTRGPVMTVLHKNMHWGVFWLMAISSGVRGTRRHKAQHIILQCWQGTIGYQCLCNLASVFSTKTCVTELWISNKDWLRNVFFQVSRFPPHAAQIKSALAHTTKAWFLRIWMLYLHIWWWCAGGRVRTWSQFLCECEPSLAHPWSSPFWLTLWQP